MTVILAAVLAGGIVAVGGGDKPRQAAPAPSSSPPSPSGSVFPDGPDATAAPGRTPGLVIVGVALSRNSTLNRLDRTANAGPWTVVVRRRDGSLGRNGAVVTFPVPAPGPGRAVRVGGVAGSVGEGAITWPAGGAYARIRGDLPERELIGIAAATVVVAGRPTVEPPPGFSVAATGTSRPRVLSEARYGSDAVKGAAALSNGLIYTGVARGGEFEDRLYAVKAQAAGSVHGNSAIVTSALGGNGLLAWEPAPGVVAYVGYSGGPLTDQATAALHRIAERTRLLGTEQWQATGPQTVYQVNDFG
ncbi:hypothetical protein OG607_06555 [Streptomyces sp. NBC_01537]|uniref:hypothetical protein n=1 Tax=Streptomyces sp. NBC_01537 TaxID=2903896 RepID=UPI0038706C03